MSRGCAFITGASSGIGEATAVALAGAGYDLVLAARRRSRLETLAEDLRRGGRRVDVVELDVRDRAAVEALSAQPFFDHVTVLVNNAGLAKGMERVQEGKLDDFDAMIDTNVKGLLYVTRALTPGLIARKGQIVNLGSVAGRWVYPGGAVYCASKFAVRAITEGLRLDLLGTGVRVTNIAPGMVETEFSEVRLGDEERAKAVYRGVQALSAADVAETIAWCLTRPAHVNVQELVLYPTDQASPGHVHRQ